MMIYLYAAAAIAFAALGAWGTYERWQAERYEAEYAAAQQQIKALGSQIATQNAAVDKLKAEGDAATKRAEDGLRAVQARVSGLAGEAARLRAQAGAARPTARPEGCPPSGADQGVAAVREGLK